MQTFIYLFHKLKKMYVGISTGKNPNYGVIGKLKYICNDRVKYCKKNDILRNIRYAGSGRLIIRDIETNKEIR